MNRAIFALLVYAVLLGAASLGSASAEPLKVVATTTVLEDLIREVGGEDVLVTSIVSSAVCPDHWDIKPSQLVTLNESSIVFQHGMEVWLSNLTRQDQKIVKLSGVWNTPQMAVNKTREVAEALKEADPANAQAYEENALALEGEINDLSGELKQRASELGTEGIKVICMEWQKGFVTFMGFDVVKTYGSEETLSIKDVNEIIQAGEDQGAVLVIDNLQSGTGVGEQIADEIGADHVALTNFPGAVPGTDTLVEMLRYNGEQLLAAV